MTLQVIGAGLPRTGTTSLKAGLEHLLGGSCYHMFELFDRVDDDGHQWWSALHGDESALDAVLDGWAAAVDWPTSVLWRELSERHPDALVVLSHRGSSATWWNSVDATVWAMMRRPSQNALFARFNTKMLDRAGFGDRWDDESAARRRYDEHFDEVVSTVDPERLLVWQASEGWEPLCDRLGLPVPAQPFFHSNDRAEFRDRGGLDDAQS